MTIANTLTPNAQLALLAIAVLLGLATLVLWVLTRALPARDFTEIKLRLRSWWVMTVLFGTAIAIDRRLSLVFLGLLSFLALREFLSLIPARAADRSGMLWAFAAIPVQYFLIASGRYELFILFVPICMPVWLTVSAVLAGETDGFLRSVATLYWGLMLTVFGLGHLALLLILPDAENPSGGAAGLILYVVLLAQFSDVAQYLFGKALGGRKVLPRISPNKTWAGFLGGAGTTVVLATFLAPWLTPLGMAAGFGAGLLIGLAGFIGDVGLSAVKRDLGVKDSGRILPGHGGVLDRVDSLIFTAPLFFHFLALVAYQPWPL